MPIPGPESQKLAARYFAITGKWPPGLLLVLDGDPVPVDLQIAGERLRKVWLRVEAEKALRDELDPPKRKTVTWTNDAGEEITIEAYEPSDNVREREENEDANDDGKV